MATPTAEKHPSPHSIYVLFEGPWLIFESGPGYPTLTAVTLGDALDNASREFLHTCAVQTWHRDRQLSETQLPVGEQWTIWARNYKQPDTCGDVFDTAYKGQNFAWIPTGCTSEVHVGDRSVVLPLPTCIHAAGILKNAQATGDILEGHGARPHVVTILEYAPDPKDGSKLSLSLHKGSCYEDYEFSPGAHLIFRLRHRGNVDELQHVSDAFEYLKGHLSEASSINFEICTDTSYDPGDSSGFTDAELGLGMSRQMEPRGLHNDTFANCCGGGIVLGGGKKGRGEKTSHSKSSSTK